ncbi:MAG: entericidin A/B family lipoprotein [Pseudomonadota bacterium]
MKKIITLLLLVAMLAIASGCETVKGVGRDLENAGEAIKRSAS